MLFARRAMIGVCGVLLVLVWWIRREVAELHEQIGRYEVRVAELREANRMNVDSLDRMINMHNACVLDRKADVAAGERTAAELRVELDALRARRPQREVIYREPSCEQLGAIDIAATCPALADELRSSARTIGTY